MIPISSISTAGAALRDSVAKPPSTQTAEQSGIFGDLFRSAAQQVQQIDSHAQTAVTGLLRGDGVDVHEAMIATQHSEMALELALQVRNKAVSAYQQMMQMQF